VVFPGNQEAVPGKKGPMVQKRQRASILEHDRSILNPGGDSTKHAVLAHELIIPFEAVAAGWGTYPRVIMGEKNMEEEAGCSPR
jgi:hypothetical protein